MRKALRNIGLGTLALGSLVGAYLAGESRGKEEGIELGRTEMKNAVEYAMLDREYWARENGNEAVGDIFWKARYWLDGKHPIEISESYKAYANNKEMWDKVYDEHAWPIGEKKPEVRSE